MSASRQQKAKLRCCASCEWVFSGGIECPKCGFGSYGARYVFGSRAYRYRFTQLPWKNRKMEAYEDTLDREIAATAISQYQPSIARLTAQSPEDETSD